MSRRLLGIHDMISRVFFWLGALALGMIMPIYLYEILMRYAFRAPTLWAADTVAFLLLFATFLVVPWLTKEKGHVAITLLPDSLPAREARLVVNAGFLVGGIICAGVGYIVAVETLSLYRRGSFTMTAVSIPRWILTACIAYGIANSALYFFRLTFAPQGQTGTGN